MSVTSPSAAEPILPRVLLGLTAVAGLVDAVSYLALGHVFTANMTGNVILLAFATAGVHGLSVTRSITALVAFFAGAVLGGRMAGRLSPGPRHRWTSAAFGAEAVLLLGAAAVALASPAWVYPLIVLTGLAMGLRNATVRKLAVPDLTTTVLTMTITGLAADSSVAGGSNSGWARRTASILTLFAGVAVGAWLLRYSVPLALGLGGAAAGVCAVVAHFVVHALDAERLGVDAKTTPAAVFVHDARAPVGTGQPGADVSWAGRRRSR